MARICALVTSPSGTDTIALLVLVVAQTMKDAQHGFGNAENLRCGDELVQKRSGLDENRRASRHRDPEAAAAARREDGSKPEIVDRRRDVVDGASLECDF